MAKRTKIHLVIVDPQNDFIGNADGTPYSVGRDMVAQLPVKGAVMDMERLSNLIDRSGRKIEDIHVTLDSHRLVDISHPVWWMDQNGRKPNPFTMISADDIEAGIWTPRNPAFRKRTLEYARALESTPRNYKIFVWPPHCLIGTWGHNVYHRLNQSLQKWSDEQYALVDYVTKGSNPWTEHYGALMAEVPDPTDPTTCLNTEFIQMLMEADIIGVAGEASSHCVSKTVMQIADNIGEEHIKKFHLLRDCMSPVPQTPGGPDFPKFAEEFFQKMKTRGMTITNSTDFLS